MKQFHATAYARDPLGTKIIAREVFQARTADEALDRAFTLHADLRGELGNVQVNLSDRSAP